MNRISAIAALSVTSAWLLGGCADSNLPGLTTSAVTPAATQTAAPKVDPACVALTAKIDALRKDGVTERIEKVAAGGKSKTVQVKRDSLAKITELDKANAEFQQKCSTITPRPAQSAAIAPAAQVAPAQAAAPAAAKKQ